MKKWVLCTFLMVGSFGCINSWSYQPTQQEKENLLATVARSSEIQQLKKIISDNTVSLATDISELKQLFIPYFFQKILPLFMCRKRPSF